MMAEFTCDGEKVKLLETTDGLSWVSEDYTEIVEWRDVIRCHKGGVSEGEPEHVQDEGEAVNAAFTVHYVEKNTDNLWKHRWKTFTNYDTDIDDIVSNISQKSKKGHPSRLLVVINPVSGRGKGSALYHEVVAPLFKLAQIETHVIVSDHPNHPEELGNTFDFSSMDGVVVVGGDGTLQKLLHTWLSRIQKDAHIELSDPGSRLKSLPCPIGMIPTGSANGLAKSSYGSTDIVTAALNIISGRTVTRNLMTFSSDGHHVGVSFVILANGLFSDILCRHDDGRWLGWLRYPRLLLTRRREFYIEVDYLPYSPLNSSPSTPETPPKENDWKRVEGTYTGILLMPSLYSPDSNSGKLKVEGNIRGMTLVLEKQCGSLRYLYWMYKVFQLRNDMFEDDFITALSVQEYRYHIVEREGETERSRQLEKCVNVDGEIKKLDIAEISVRNHTDMMDIYGSCYKL